MAFLCRSCQRNIEHALQHHFQHTEEVSRYRRHGKHVHKVACSGMRVLFCLLAIIIPILDQKQSKAIAVLLVRPPTQQSSLHLSIINWMQ